MLNLTRRQPKGFHKEAFCSRAIDNAVRTDLIKAKLFQKPGEPEAESEAKGAKKQRIPSFICLLLLCSCFGAVTGCFGLVFLFIDKTHKFDDLFPAGYTKKEMKKRNISEER